ncbi:MAG: hypothetical protein IJX92_04420 [Clostridia bacterium]|nr:hypothetical protein [Clostridia bacterium]
MQKMTEAIGLLDINEEKESAPSGEDSRAHITSAVPRGACSPESPMTQREMERARELFSGLSDSEIHNLYKRVTK